MRLGRLIDTAQLVFGCAVLPTVFRAVGHRRVERASHEPATNAGRSFISDASAVDKLLFVLKMLGTHRANEWRRAWRPLRQRLVRAAERARAAPRGAKPSDALEKAPSRVADEITRASVEDSTVIPQHRRVREVVFLGDLLFHEALGQSSLSDALRARLARADALVINLEGTIGPTGSELYPFQSARGLRQMLRWNSTGEPSAWVSRFEEDRLRAMLGGLPPTWFTLANNHTLDEGGAGLARTIEAINRLGAGHVGSDSNCGAAAIVEIGTVRLGIVAIGLGQNHAAHARPVGGCGLTFPEVPYRLPAQEIERQLERLERAGASFIAAVVHWGYEHEHVPRADQVECVEQLWDLGVGAVIGHHPHLIQPSFSDGARSVSFSLGDFVGGDRTIFNRMSHAVSLRFDPTLGPAPHVDVFGLVQAPYWEKRHVTCLESEAPLLERRVWKALFEPKLRASLR